MPCRQVHAPDSPYHRVSADLCIFIRCRNLYQKPCTRPRLYKTALDLAVKIRALVAQLCEQFELVAQLVFVCAGVRLRHRAEDANCTTEHYPAHVEQLLASKVDPDGLAVEEAMAHHAHRGSPDAVHNAANYLARGAAQLPALAQWRLDVCGNVACHQQQTPALKLRQRRL